MFVKGGQRHIKRTSPPYFKNCTKIKIYIVHLRLRLMLQTRISCSSTYSTPAISERFLRWFSNEVYITITWDAASWCARNSSENRYFLYLPAVRDYKRLDTSWCFIITNFHIELKP